MRLLLRCRQALARTLVFRKADVKHPGSRGGRGYYNERARWRYGEHPVGGKLPEDHGRYFHLPAGTEHVPIDKLRSTRARPLGIEHAEGHMRAAHEGRGAKRGPVLIAEQNSEGQYPILSGNSTYHVAKKHGWQTLPARRGTGQFRSELQALREREHMSSCETCRWRPNMHPLCAERLRATALKARLVFAKPPDPSGAHTLGKTKRGKKVFASGGESHEFNDQDHHDAARLHHAAHLYHHERAKDHGAIAEKDDDWQRSEIHHGEHGRHKALADHHADLVQDHLIAGGHGGETTFGFEGDKPTLGEVAPHSEAARRAAKKRLLARTHHSHPGGANDRDRIAYGDLAAREKTK